MKDISPQSVVANNGRLERIGARILGVEAAMRTVMQLTFSATLALFAITYYLHQSAMGDVYKTIIPYMPTIGIIAAWAGWYFTEAEIAVRRRHVSDGEKIERFLKEHGVEVPTWEYITDDGTSREGREPQINQLGLVYGLICLIWVVPIVRTVL